MEQVEYGYLYYNNIDSTNNEAKRLIESQRINGPVLIVAKEQSAGRGRQGRSFFSPADTGLYMTLAIPMNCPIASQVTITTRAAVAVSSAIEAEYAGINPEIKWVNDIYVSGRKVCGILCEAVNDYESGILKWVIIGAGVNISTMDWPKELEDRAGSLETLGGNRILTGAKPMSDNLEPDPLAGRIAKEILNGISNMSDRQYLNYYREHSNVIGREIVFTQNGAVRQAFALDVDEEGGLLVEVTDGPEKGERLTLNSGEITVRVPDCK